MNVTLRDTTVILTGSSGGLGTALVRALRVDGAQVIGIDIVPPNGPFPDVFVEGDVRDEMTIQRAIARAATNTWCFVPCAAIGVFGEAPPSDVVAVNYSAAIANVRTVATTLSSAGSAVLIGSVAAARHDFARSWSVTENLQLMSRGGSLTHETAYGLSKWALARAAPRLAAALAPQRTRVNLAVLGPTETPAAARLRLEQPIWWTQLLAETPSGRMNTTEDVVAAVTFLLSPLASRITGSTICIDGGWTACRQPPST